MATIAPIGKYILPNVPGGKVYTYEAGTTTPKATFTTQDESVSNANPVVLDANGRADIWLGDGGYKFVVTDANDVELFSSDNLGGSSSVAFGNAVNSITASTPITDVYANSFNVCTNSPTLSLLSAATAGEGFYFTVVNEGSGTVTIDPDASETIAGASTLAIAPDQGGIIICDGSAWQFFGTVGFPTLAADNTFTGDNIFQGVVDVTNINAEGSGGGHLRTNGGTNCLSWGGGGSANLTAGGNLSMDTTHKIVNCADPTSAQDVATKNYVDNNVPTDNGWQLISTVTASTSATVDFTSGIDGTYDVYKITVADIDPSSDAALEMFFSTDGGSSYISSSYFYSQEVIKANATTGNLRSNSSSRIAIAGDLLNWGGASNEGLSGEIMIYAPSGSTQYKKATFFITGSDTATNTQCCVGTCGWYGTTAINAIRLNMSAGNFASGNFALYGLKK
jgi:hypothetical protein